MFRTSPSIVSLFACLAISACSDDGVIRKPDGDGSSGKALADFRASLEQPRDETIPDGPQIDPGAQNIDPFKYDLQYNYQEREILAGLLDEARDDADYLTRSLPATRQGLEEFKPSIKWDDYVTYMECAVTADLAARNGLLSAYRGQELAAKFITAGLDPTYGTLTPEEREQYEAERSELLEAESARERYTREEEEKEQLNKLRTRNYLNYFLMRDRDMDQYTAEDLQGRLDTCLEFDDVVAIELETEE